MYAPKINMNGSTHSTYSVKAKSQAGSIRVKYIMTAQGQSRKKMS